MLVLCHGLVFNKAPAALTQWNRCSEGGGVLTGGVGGGGDQGSEEVLFVIGIKLV